jgi:hypothetical protein
MTDDTPNTPDTPDDAVRGLVMPFVVTTDQGGPYDAEAFCAGLECEGILSDLRAIAKMSNVVLTSVRAEKYVPPGLVPQLELVAMACGFTLTHELWDEHPEEWTRAGWPSDRPGRLCTRVHLMKVERGSAGTGPRSARQGSACLSGAAGRVAGVGLLSR